MSRGLDHLVLATRNLDATAEVYRRLGFTVGRQNRHAWGTLNHVIQMPGTFLELIGLEPGFRAPPQSDPVWPFAGFIEHYLSAREGFAMLVLEAADATAEQARLAGHGIAAPSTFRFERRGTRADGSPVHLAFTLAFGHVPVTPAAGYFLCQQHFPENFWAPALQMHANTVTGVEAVTFATTDVARAARTLEQFAGAVATPRGDGVVEIQTARGRIEVATRAQAEALYGTGTLPDGPETGYWAGVRFYVADRDAARRCIAASGLTHRPVGPRLVVAAEAVHGVALGFG